MPYSIRKVRNGFAVFNKATGKRKNKKPKSRAEARAYLKALYANTSDIKR